MIATKKVDYAISETLKVHPDFRKDINQMIFKNITSELGISIRNFTSRNDARKLISEVTQDDMLQFILEEVVKIYNSIAQYYHSDEKIKRMPSSVDKMNELLRVFPDYPEIRNIVEYIADADNIDKTAKSSKEKINVMIYFQTHSNDLLRLVNIVSKYRYQSNDKLKKYIDENGYTLTNINSYANADLFEKIVSDASKTQIAKNVRVNHSAVNKCLIDVLSGAQLKSKHNEYSLDGNLFASQDVGRRSNQEDSVVILTHPENPEFKLLAVSDGMGGAEKGEIASQYTIKELARWFENLSSELYFYPLELQQLLNKKIELISKEIYNTYNRDYNSIQTGATLVTASVTQNYTVISTVGDSRAYSVSNGNIQLLTRDESAVWPPTLNAKQITEQELDDLRFNRRNNYITSCIGEEISAKGIQTNIVENRSYDRILLLSDGITDLLTQERIRIISNSTSPENIANQLVHDAITYNAVREQGEDEMHRGFIRAGKDNSTAAVYNRRR